MTYINKYKGLIGKSCCTGSFFNFRTIFILVLSCLMQIAYAQKSNPLPPDEGDNCDCPYNFRVKIGTNASSVTRYSQVRNMFRPIPAPAGNCILVEGTFVIDMDAYFRECHFSMAPGSRILIKGGVQGNWLNSTLAGCAPRWYGIHVEGGGRISIQGNHISGAYDAVTLEDQSVVARIGGNTFENNLAGIYVPEAAIPKLSYPIGANTFIKGAFGVKNLGTIDIGSSGVGANIFGPELTTGIYTSVGAMKVENNTFMENETGILSEYGELVTVKVNQFYNCILGIHSKGTAVTVLKNFMRGISTIGVNVMLTHGRPVHIEGGNDIEASVPISLDIVQTDDLVVQNNLLSNNQAILSFTGISIANVSSNLSDANVRLNKITAQNGFDAAGIAITEGFKLNVNNNTITMKNSYGNNCIIAGGAYKCKVSENTIDGGGTLGIGLLAVTSYEMGYCCNTISNVINGLVVEGFNYPSNVQANTFGGSQPVGLYYRETAFTGEQEQKGNLWSGNYSALAAYFQSNNQNWVARSRYNVSSSSRPLFPAPVFPDNGPNNGPWFYVKSGSPAGCNSPCSLMNFGDDEGEGNAETIRNYKDIAGIGLYGDDYPALQYLSERYLLERLEANPALENYPELAGFSTAHSQSSLMALHEVQKGIRKLGLGTGWEAYTQSLHALSDKQAAIGSLDKALGQATGQDSSQLVQQRDVLMAEFAGLLSISRAYSVVLNETLKSAMTHLLAEAEGISTFAAHEGKEQMAKTSLLKVGLAGASALTTSELAALETLALECPLVAGNAIFTARAVLTAATGRSDFGAWECGDQAGKTLERAGKAKSFDEDSIHVYPNPAKQRIFIELPRTGAESKWQVSLINSLGVEVIKEKEVTGNIILNIQGLANGIYTLRMQGEEIEIARHITISQ